MVVEAPAGVGKWRVLRNETGVFSGALDPSAFLVHDGDERFLTDYRFLVNGVVYFYAVYGLVSVGVWSPPVIGSATPQALFEDLSIDAQEVVRDRLEVALQSLIQRGRLAITKPTVPVMSIPFYSQGGDLPVVTVLYASGASVVHGVGEKLSQNSTDGVTWVDAQGWHESVSLEISAWSFNAQERNVLRRALEASIAVNLDIFSDAGLNMPEVQSVQDTEDTQSMNAPVYQTVIRFNCQVIVAVSEVDGVINTVFADIY